MNSPAIQDALLHITDIHFWEVVWNPLRLLNKRFLGNVNVILRRRHTYRTEQRKPFAQALRDTGVRSLYAGGDFTSTATETEFRDAADFVRSLSKSGIQVIATPGNHDVYTFEAKRKRRFEKYFADFAPPEPLPCQVNLPGGTPLILAPTVCPNLVSSKGRITDADAAAVAELLAACPAGPILVGGHYPVLHETYAYHTASARRLRNAEALRKAMGESGRQVLYLSGHVHRFSYLRDPEYPNLHHLTTSALFMHRRGRRRHGAFSEVRVTHDGFEVTEHWLEETWQSAVRKPK